MHYADKAISGSRHYRDSTKKLTAALEQFKQTNVDFVVELGDFVDRAKDVETELRYLATIEREFARCGTDRHYVLGNHCVDTLTKSEFLSHCGLRKTEKNAFYSFDAGEFHFVVLDACFRKDGVSYGRQNYAWTDTNIPTPQQEWLRKDLAATNRPTIAFVHQRLDVSNKFGVKNGSDVRKILDESRKVLAVFQGHNHTNDHKKIGDVNYVTLAAMVEGAASGKHSAYSVLECYPEGVLRIDGFVSQKDWNLQGVLPKTTKRVRKV
jgi:alkaline phosphatase